MLGKYNISLVLTLWLILITFRLSFEVFRLALKKAVAGNINNRLLTGGSHLASSHAYSILSPHPYHHYCHHHHHYQVKSSNYIISRCFGDFMMPLSRVQMRIKLTNASSRVTTDLHSGGGYTNTLARIESVCTFKLGVNCLM